MQDLLSTPPSALQRGVLRALPTAAIGVALGALLFLALAMKWPVALSASTGSAAHAAPSWWVADRDANRLVGLDDDLFLGPQHALRHPVRVAAVGDGHWIAAAVGGNPLGRHALFFAAVGVGAGAVPGIVPGGGDLGPLLDLQGMVSGGVLCVEFGLAGQPSRVLRSTGAAVAGTPQGPGLEVFVEHPGATAALGVPASESGASAGAVLGAALVEDVLVGDDQGKLTRYAPDGSVRSAVSLGGELGDLQRGPGGRVFALVVTGGGRIVCLNQELQELWSVATGLATERLSVVPGHERLWIADTTEPFARRFGPGGVLELEVRLPASDVSAALAGADGGALFTTPGAVLRVDPYGAILPGQGGFDYLTDIAPGV